MISTYSLLVFVHVFAAVAWVGGATLLEFLDIRMSRAQKPELIREFFGIASWLSPKLFMPAALLTLLSGLILVFIGGALWKEFWIIFALVGIAIVTIIGAKIVGPTTDEINTLINQGEIDSPITKKLQRKLQVAAYIDFALLVILLFDMVIKPYTADFSFILGSFIILGIGIIAVFRSRPQQ